jgi:hypothetical protein
MTACGFSVAGHVSRQDMARHDQLQCSHQCLCGGQVLGKGIGSTGRLQDLGDAGYHQLQRSHHGVWERRTASSCSFSFAGHVDGKDVTRHNQLQCSHQCLCGGRVLGMGIGATGRLQDLGDTRYHQLQRSHHGVRERRTATACIFSFGGHVS